jgi:hypothetical protein
MLVAQELELGPRCEYFVFHLCLRFEITNARNRAEIMTMAVETGNSGSTIS